MSDQLKFLRQAWIKPHELETVHGTSYNNFMIGRKETKLQL